MINRRGRAYTGIRHVNMFKRFKHISKLLVIAWVVLPNHFLVAISADSRWAGRGAVQNPLLDSDSMTQIQEFHVLYCGAFS